MTAFQYAGGTFAQCVEFLFETGADDPDEDAGDKNAADRDDGHEHEEADIRRIVSR